MVEEEQEEYDGTTVVGLAPATFTLHFIAGIEREGRLFTPGDKDATPVRDREEQGLTTWLPSLAAFDSRIVGPLRSCKFYGRTQETSSKTGYLKTRITRTGTTRLFEGMFSARDKLARIGVVCTITGVPLGNTDVILNGINHREIVKTDVRGVWWKYLEIDEYPDALFISPNGIVYALLEQKERIDNEGIFDQIVQRRTIANATHRQFHRQFI